MRQTGGRRGIPQALFCTGAGERAPWSPPAPPVGGPAAPTALPARPARSGSGKVGGENSLILRNCEPDRQREICRIFEKKPFGELERLVTQKLLDVAQGVAREQWRSEEWLRMIAQLSDRSYEQMRVAILEFLDADVFDVSVDNCVSFLDPMIESWDLDLKTFGLEIVLNRRLAPGGLKRFECVEKEPEQPAAIEPGFEQFLKDTSLNGDITEEEIDFLKLLKFNGRRPSPIYYRALQNLRDPLHFPAAAQPKQSD